MLAGVAVVHGTVRAALEVAVVQVPVEITHPKQPVGQAQPIQVEVVVGQQTKGVPEVLEQAAPV